jgi:2-keto-3-deoxy-6-phosphogluconate aldolase
LIGILRDLVIGLGHCTVFVQIAAAAVASSGIPVVEITLTVPQATKVIAHLLKTMPGIVVGAAGGVASAAMAQECIDAGAHFLTSDGLHPEVIDLAAKREVVVIPLRPRSLLHGD